MIRLERNDTDNADESAQEAQDSTESLDSLDFDSLDLGDSLDDSTPSTEDLSPDAPRKSGDLGSFSKEVLRVLESKNIPPLPANYQAFFEQLLNGYDVEFQRKISSLLEADSAEDDRNIIFEKHIHLAFAKTKELLRCTSEIYKSFTLRDEIQQNILKDLHINAESSHYHRDLQKVQETINAQIDQLKAIYQQCNRALENINTSTMYDSKFDVYNKRYFIHLVQQEVALVRKFQHSSTVLMVALPSSVIRYLDNDQIAIVVMKTVAKLLLKTSRRSDMIGYIGNGIFGMLLKHSGIFSSKKASERLIELLKNTNIFIGSNEITLDLNIGIAKISAERNAEDSLNYAISSLRQAQQNKEPYVVHKADEND